MSKARDTLDAFSLVNAPNDGKNYLRKFNGWEEVPVAGYALMDFGTVTTGNRYVQANPFGNTPVITYLELYHAGGNGSEAGWGHVHGMQQWSDGSMYGTMCGRLNNEIVVVTGANGITHTSSVSGDPFSISGWAMPSAPCRVHVWRLAV